MNLSDSKFWEHEDIIQQNNEDAPKDDSTELYYQNTVTRADDGKFIVKMPLHPD